jgi:integrase
MVRKDENGRAYFVRDELGRVRSKRGLYLSRVNLYCSFFILLNTGMRVSELFSLKYSDIRKQSLGRKGGFERVVYLLTVKETKPFRVKKTTQRIVVAPKRIEGWLQLLRRENPIHCGPDDFVINREGKRRKSLQNLFEKVQSGFPSEDGFRSHRYKGKVIDLSHHESGTNLDLRHLRSYYVSRLLIDKGISPFILERQTGHGLNTILSYYLTRKPSGKAMRLLGGWETTEEHLSIADKMFK